MTDKRLVREIEISAGEVWLIEQALHCILKRAEKYPDPNKEDYERLLVRVRDIFSDL